MSESPQTISVFWIWAKISNEDVETFALLFKSWLACVSEIPHTAIITDHDSAMKMVVDVIFPNARHHIVVLVLHHEKLPKNLGSTGKNYKSIKSCIKVVVYDSLKNVEFEDTWRKLIMKYSLGNNEW